MRQTWQVQFSTGGFKRLPKEEFKQLVTEQPSTLLGRGAVAAELYMHKTLYTYREREIYIYIHIYTYIRLLKVLLIKNPSPNPKFSEYIFKRSQYIL